MAPQPLSFQPEIINKDEIPEIDIHMIAPLTEKLSREYESCLKFCKLNVGENPQMARKYKVMSIPLLLLLFKGGRILYESVGAVPERIIRLKIEAML